MIWHCLQIVIVFLGDNLQEMSNPFFREKIRKNPTIWSAESAHSMVSANKENV